MKLQIFHPFPAGKVCKTTQNSGIQIFINPTNNQSVTGANLIVDWLYKLTYFAAVAPKNGDDELNEKLWAEPVTPKKSCYRWLST
jgi:hypothetical protein